MADIANTPAYLAYAAIGGMLPALFWLWFWLQEDKLHPEPRSRIMLAFLGGMVGFILPSTWPTMRLSSALPATRTGPCKPPSISAA